LLLSFSLLYLGFNFLANLGIEQYCRWVYEGVIDDPYGEFFIAEDKSLQKVDHHHHHE